MPAATFPELPLLCAEILTGVFFGPLGSLLLGAGLSG